MKDNRLLIYFFYDRDGVVDGYIPYFLRSMRGLCREICFVVNGILGTESRDLVESCVDRIIIRENSGMDAAAYREVISLYGYESLVRFDEVVCTNFTFFGPLFPLEEMFCAMEKRKCDWWTMYKWPIHHEIGSLPFVFAHVPSGFTVYRNTLLSSVHFRRYWESLPPTDTYETSCLYHEQRQTPYYDKLGFRNAEYIDHSSLFDEEVVHFPLSSADELLKKGRAPLLKRRVFFNESNSYLYPNALLNVLDYIRNHTSYPIHFLLDNLRRTQSPLRLRGDKLARKCDLAIFGSQCQGSISR